MRVAELGLGTHRLRLEEFSGAVRRAGENLDTAWADTAPNYLGGRAQSLLAPHLVRYPSLQVSTKVGFLTKEATAAATRVGVLSAEAAAFGHCLATEYVRWQCARNRAELNRTSVDVVFAHNPERAGDPHAALREAFTALEEEAHAGTLISYGVATWDGFERGSFTVPELDRLATEVAGTAQHHLRAVQLPVSLVMARAFGQALQGTGPIAEAAERGWEVFASAPLFGGELAELASRELADLLAPDLSVTQACLLAVGSCPGVTRLLLSASSAEHWSEARTALAHPAIKVPTLQRVLDVLAPG